MDHSEDNLDEQFFRDSNWVASNGGWIHANNVLFYFAQSPFFDRQSSNSSVAQTAFSDPRFSHWLNTRHDFEGQLQRVAGVEYVVAYDPLALHVQIPGPTGPEHSNVWVIKKQERLKRSGQEDQVTVLAFYHIIGDSIYQAPSVGKILTNRMLSTVTSLTKLLSTATPLPVFAPSAGHTYFSPVQKTPKAAELGISVPSKEPTPMPGSQTEASQKSTATAVGSSVQDTRTLIEGINMSLRYGKEYMDEVPLVGEPGNFRLSNLKTKSSLAPLNHTSQPDSRQTSPEKKPTPAPSPPPPPPPIQTDVPPISGKKSGKGTDRTPATPGSSAKTKRRKSKAANVVTPSTPASGLVTGTSEA